MSRHNEFFRKKHPEQFSDSKIVQVGKLDRDFFDFFLESLTSKSLEKEFENFCRHIAEAEICPNLLPQTGPTGGGDSKVDSETYPVAKSISELWYYGEDNKAGTERWAFAISAKKDWKTKVKSDVQKIVKVNEVEMRGYSKIFFMSNQYVSDKKRAETEDTLRKEFCIDIRILDRTWLLEKVFANPNNKNLAIECFALSDSFSDEVKIGSRDYKRKQEFEAVEKQLGSKDIKRSEYVPLARRSVVLARELEFPNHQVLGLLDRYEKFAETYGTELDVADAIYNTAWTIYWWYPDDKYYYECYKKYENIALSKDNVHLFSNLITLWINLYALSISPDGESIHIAEHTKLIQEKYAKYISDTSKPNTAIEAKAAYQLMRFFLGDTINEIVDDLIVILNDSSGHLDLDLYPLSRVIQEFPMLEKAHRYNELFELVISTMSQQKKDSSAAIMLAKRGHSLKQEKPYEALSYFSRTLMSLYNEQDKSHLIRVIMEMGNIFENVGLLWSARNFYYYDFCLCLNQYMKFGQVYPALFISAHALKYTELRLGQIIYSIEFDFLEKIAMQIYPENIIESEMGNDNYDYILAIQLLRTPFETIKRLEQLPAYLEKQDLIFSNAAIKYELGYYDESILAELQGDRTAFDDLIGKWKVQPALEKLNNKPWYGLELPYVMKTNVLGCTYELTISKPLEHGEVEVAATILATIESFFGTGIANELVSVVGKILINLSFEADNDSLIKGNILDDRPNVINIVFRDYKASKIVEEQHVFYDFLLELLGMVIAIMFPFESALKKIEKMIANDAAFARSQTFSNSVFYGMETLGKSTFSFETVIQGYDHLPLMRSKKSEITDCREEKKDLSEPINPERVHYEKPPEELDFKNISHENIRTSSIINIPLWNKCDWKGVLFLTASMQSVPPVLAPVFTKPSCANIFEEWIKDIGAYDKDDIISIKLIKGINKTHPFWYRVIIGSSKFPESKGNELIIIVQLSRLHTMEAENNMNLKRFEEALLRSTTYSICPALMSSPTARPELYNKFMIKKNSTSISICNAWEVESNDFLAINGVLPTDDPIIPEGKEDAPILAAIKRKRMNESL